MNSEHLQVMDCKCGSEARVRYKIPYYWVECKRKCGMKTGFYPDKKEVRDPQSEDEAVKAWNRMMLNK